MAIVEKNIDEKGFRATIFTLTCDKTGKKLADILVKKDNTDLEDPVYMYVRATSPFFPGADSGTHKVGGLLSFGPIDSEDSKTPTLIEDVEYNNDDGVEITTLKVREI